MSEIVVLKCKSLSNPELRSVNIFSKTNYYRNFNFYSEFEFFLQDYVLVMKKITVKYCVFFKGKICIYTFVVHNIY